MKKLFAIAVTALLASSASASYLYWQVMDNDSGTAFSSLSGDVLSSITHAQISVKDTTSGDTVASGLASVEKVGSSLEAASASYINLSGVDLSTGAYSFFIELGTYESSTFSGKAISETITTTAGETWSSYVALNSAIVETAPLSASDLVSVMPWHGGTYSVPEPTSAILMLFGAAMLGLKRKNRSIA